MSNIKLTKEQKDAIKSVSKFINDSKINEQDWFTLEGKAGVGKTTVIIELIKKYVEKDKNVVVSALAHKAKNVLRDKYKVVKKKHSAYVTFCSLASLLGMRFNEQTGKFEYSSISNGLRPIDTADIIFVDECSMIDSEALGFILQNKKFRSKLIFSGDIGQLPPVSDGSNISPTFNTKNKFCLTERLRQCDVSPILPYSDLYWNSVVEKVDYVTKSIRQSALNGGSGLYFGNRSNIFNMCIGTFKNAVSRKDLNLIKYICYRNSTREVMNQRIREHIFGDEIKEYCVGDFMIMMDNYIASEDCIIENSSEFIVTSVKEKFDVVDNEDIHVYELEMEDLNISIPVVAKDSIILFNKLVTERFNKAKKEKESFLKKKAFSDAYALKNKYANIDFSYAITSHKSQGSTYSCCIVDEPDIMSVSLVNIITKYRSMYTSITRASKLCVIIN